MDVYRGSVPGENIQSRVLHLLVCVAVVAYVFDFSHLVEEFRFLAFVNNFFVNYGSALFALCGCGQMVWDRVDVASEYKVKA